MRIWWRLRSLRASSSSSRSIPAPGCNIFCCTATVNSSTRYRTWRPAARAAKREDGSPSGPQSPIRSRVRGQGEGQGAGAGTGLQRRGPAQNQAPAGRQLEMHVLRPHEPFRQGLLPEVRGGSIFRSAVTEFFSAPGAGQTGFRLFGPVRRKTPGKSRHFPGKNSCTGSVFVVNYCVVRKC